MTRREAIMAGATRHIGKVCEKHPELNGERLTSNNKCVACHRAKVKQRRKEKLVEAQLAGLTRYNGKVCERHPELNGERYVANSRCVACHRIKARKEPA